MQRREDRLNQVRAAQSTGVTTAGAPHLVHTDAEGVEEWMAFFSDPNGNTLALMARVATM